MNTNTDLILQLIAACRTARAAAARARDLATGDIRYAASEAAHTLEDLIKDLELARILQSLDEDDPH